MSDRRFPSISQREYADQMDARDRRKRAHEAFWDAVCADDSPVSFCDRQTGEVDAQGLEIVDALLAAGWSPPGSG